MLWMLLACDAVTLRANFADREPGLLYEAADLTLAPDQLDQLVVLNYNIKYGGGRLIFFWECEGERYNMTETEVTTHLDNIASFITEVDPDILILQEVDRETRRSVYLDQVQYLLDRTPLNYGAYASQHRVDYLPTDGMGHVDFGNAILTRWPIAQSTRVALPLVDAYPAYYRYLYLKRHVLLADIELPWQDTPFTVVNTHLEAFSEGNAKLNQIDVLHQELSALTEAGHQWVMGGDLNSLPNGSTQLKEFADDCPGMFEVDDYSGEEDWLDSLYADFIPAMSLEAYAADQESWYSYAGKQDVGWTRTLDYMFSNISWTNDGADNVVLQDESQGGYETLSLSDHAPVFGQLEVQ